MLVNRLSRRRLDGSRVLTNLGSDVEQRDHDGNRADDFRDVCEIREHRAETSSASLEARRRSSDRAEPLVGIARREDFRQMIEIERERVAQRNLRAFLDELARDS